MTKSWILFLCMISSSLAFGQLGGESTYEFLNLVASPRQAALGGKNVTTRDYDPTSAIFNPALINSEMHNQLSLNYTSYLADVNYGTASYAYEFNEDLGVFHSGVKYINYGTFDGYDAQGNSTGEFSGGETAVSFGYAYQIPESDFFVGGNLRVISSQLEQYNSWGLSADVGVSYVNDSTNLIVSGVLRNAGTQLTPYDSQYEKLPLEVVLGISQLIKNVPIRWHVTLDNLQKWDIAYRNPARDETDLEGNTIADDPGFFNNALRHVILGLELFPQSSFNIRLGYSFRRGEELRILDQRSFAGLSGGLSIKFNKIRLSYSYARYNSAASSSFFGLNINLN